MRVEVDLTGIMSMEDLRQRVSESLLVEPDGDQERPVVDVVLRGTLGFQRAALDQPALVELVRERYDALHARVTLEVDVIPAPGETARTGTRQQIERDVVHDLLVQQPGLAHEADTLADHTLALKRAVLEGQDQEALAAIVEGTLTQAARIGDASTYGSEAV